ncbi:MAG: DUF721 domain-containing protein [Bacteroidaceae bacterium]|nr:DUF721 domain-containing protein [Bacteroidaceae bacterium]
MRRQKTQRIDELLNMVLREEGLETPINEYRLMHEAWADVMGQGIVRYTGNMFIKNSTLFVQLKSSALRQDLMMGRVTLVHRLNQAVGAQVIEKLVFL